MQRHLNLFHPLTYSKHKPHTLYFHACIYMYTLSITSCVLSYAFTVLCFWIHATACLRRTSWPGWNTCRSYEWLEIYWWTFQALLLLLSWHHIRLLFPSLSAGRLFPRETPGRCLRSPEGRGDESKVNTFKGGCKKTRAWKLRSQSESTCCRKSSTSIVPKISHVKVIKGVCLSAKLLPS